MTPISYEASTSGGAATILLNRPLGRVSTPSLYPMLDDELVTMKTHIAAPAAKFVILIVEDDYGEQFLLERALRDLSVKVDLRIVDDGEDALNYLFHKKQFASPNAAPRPHLILLDLNLPKVSGKEVLCTARHNPETAAIAILALSNSSSEEDIQALYRLGVNSYLVKPTSPKHYSELVASVEHYWFHTAVLPPTRA